jgi:hypothetical protein
MVPGINRTPQIGCAAGENHSGRAGLPPLCWLGFGSPSTRIWRSSSGCTIPEMVVLLTQAWRANSTRLVGPRSKSACNTRPRLVDPTKDDDKRDRARSGRRIVSRVSPSGRGAAARPDLKSWSASRSIFAQSHKKFQ